MRDTAILASHSLESDIHSNQSLSVAASMRNIAQIATKMGGSNYHVTCLLTSSAVAKSSRFSSHLKPE
jgi:hypothetical protein